MWQRISLRHPRAGPLAAYFSNRLARVVFTAAILPWLVALRWLGNKANGPFGGRAEYLPLGFFIVARKCGA